MGIFTSDANGAGGGLSAATAAEDVPADVSFEDDGTGVGSSTATVVEDGLAAVNPGTNVSDALEDGGTGELTFASGI